MLKRLLARWWSERRGGADLKPAVRLINEGRLADAEDVLRGACAQYTSDAPAWHLYGHTLSLRGKSEASIRALQRATDLAPENADAVYSLASALRSAGEAARAIELYRRVTALRPDAHAAWLALADLHAERDPDEAEALYERALASAPASAEIHYNYGNLLLRCGRAEEAVARYREAVALQPAFVRAYSNLLCALTYADSASAEEIRDAHLEFDARYARGLASATPHRLRRAGERVRVGYVSPDFREHAVGRLVEPVLQHHDRERVMVHCYSDVKRPDASTARMRAYAAVWRDIAGMDDDAVAALVREDGIDVLVDLAGHTDDHRLLVFARKPAPVQVTWIGYPNTTGLAAMDYRISDAYADPAGMTEHLYSERLFRLPDVYLPCAAPPERIDPGPPPSASLGRVTFGSFNNLAKVSGTAVRLWSSVLRAVPESRLLILTAPEGRTRLRLLEAFAAHGVSADRVELRGRLDHESFLRAHREVDIALDTFPYHGTTTTVHTLWMGVPVVTLAGDTHRARAGASLLANAGCGDLVAQSAGEYVGIAAALARDGARLRMLRSTLRERVESGPIMDGARFARALERAYEEMLAAVAVRLSKPGSDPDDAGV